MTTPITIIRIPPHFDPITCALCRQQFKPLNGPWPAVERQPHRYRLVCLRCASDNEPADAYADDWQDILDQIAMGTHAQPDHVAIGQAMTDLEREMQRRETAGDSK